MNLFNLNEDVHSLSDFKRNTPEFIERLESSGRPALLTVNGKGKVVVQDAESYQKLLDSLDRAETLEAIRQGLEDIKAGRTRPVKEFLDDVRKEFGFPEKRKAKK
ncbi:MAG: type II toxin-antitoxin system Phd/YefM family antitoxin [Acidobacteria bacterium]|nr:type II toxin-antitoxin system Phd/YefM family antitoxin [Acidobacteriota bacterium]